MIADAATLAAANQKLSQSIMASEMEQASSWYAIDALDLASAGDDAGIEMRANEAFAASIDELRAVTAR